MNALEITPSGRALGARLTGIDLSEQVSNEIVDIIMRALGEHGVLCFPGQNLTAKQQRDFAARFGQLEINVANAYQEPGLPEVMILSNIRENGRQIGMLDAGQDWHTDMSYNRMIALANVLYAVKVPQRNGRPLGATRFANMHQACQDLPGDIRQRLEGMTVLHDFNKFWDMMRREKGSTRPPLTQAQRDAKPPVSHPLLLRHPLTGRQVLYANPGYAVRINELPEKESDAMLEFLFRHQLQEKYQYAHEWTAGDVLMLDNIGTLHFAVPDYSPDEHRLLRRCQVMATRFFDDDGRPIDAGAAVPGAAAH